MRCTSPVDGCCNTISNHFSGCPLFPAAEQPTMGVGIQNDMQMFLQLLRQKVAAEEAVATHTTAVSEDEDDSVEPIENSAVPWYPPQVMERTVDYTNGDTYKGEMLGDQRHGKGMHTTSVGDVYDGSWLYDLRHGHGKFTTKDGTTYEGDWEDDKATGTGVCKYSDGSMYDGEWQSDMRHGWGLLKTADGQSYEGEWKDNAMHGQGRWVFADGLSYFEGTYECGNRTHGQLVMFDPVTRKQLQSYTGRFKNNLRDGEGVGVEEGLWVYRGHWRKDMRHGQGTCSYADGTVYEGSWKCDKRDGVGTLKLSSGYQYEGEWKDDKQHGNGNRYNLYQGKARYADGSRYIGQWRNGKRHGQGKWTSAPIAAAGSSSDGSSGSSERREQYAGSWVDDRREGQGVAVFADGGRYQGGWKADKRHGQGLMMFADGTVFRGQWDGDCWVQSGADPALTRLKGPGLSRATAGQTAVFTIKARDENNQPRLNGGDVFQVLLVPRVTPTTAAAEPLAPAAAAAVPLSVAEPAAAAAAALREVASTSRDNTDRSVLGRSKLISHPLLLPGSSDGSSSSSSSGGDKDSTVLLQQLDAEVKSQCSYDILFDDNRDGCENGSEAETATATITAAAVGDVQDNGDGTYSCSYTYNTAGLYELHVTNDEGEHVGGEHVGDSPYPIKILPGTPSARHSIVTGPGRHTATAGATAQFEVRVKDAFGNGFELQHNPVHLPNLQAQLLGSNTLPVATVVIEPAPGGRYCCSYTAPTRAGLYVLEVTAAGGKHLQASPSSVKVTEPAQIAETSEASAAAAAALAPADTTAAAAAVPDRLEWWGEIAREAYAAIDGCLDGFEESRNSTKDDDPHNGLSGPEADLVKANPDIPVVERLKDLWLLSKLQQEKKLKQHQQQQKQQKARTAHSVSANAASKSATEVEQPRASVDCSPAPALGPKKVVDANAAHRPIAQQYTPLAVDVSETVAERAATVAATTDSAAGASPSSSVACPEHGDVVQGHLSVAGGMSRGFSPEQSVLYELD